MPRTILLASPREPSGGSWIVNCLLELGVRVNVKPTVDRAWSSSTRAPDASAVWQPAGDGSWRLHPRAEALTKWLPILSRRETLVFRDDVEVLYVQDLPDPAVKGERTALFLRDPRDAIHSLYRRNRPDMSLQEFVQFPHHETLLDAVGHWRLFMECWLARAGSNVYRFEDYKADDEALLTRIVGDLGIDVSAGAVENAAAESSYEKAREAEERYRARHPGDEEVAMRAGMVGEWMTSESLREVSRDIERHTAHLLSALGYSLQEEWPASNGPAGLDGVSQLHFLRAYDAIDLPSTMRESLVAADPLACQHLPGLLSLASTLDPELIRRARLETQDARTLVDSLQEYATAWHDRARLHLTEARGSFDNGAGYHMSRLRELLASRRQERTGEPRNQADAAAS